VVHAERSPLAFALRLLDPTLVAAALPFTCLVLGESFARPHQLLAVLAFLAGVTAFRTAGLYRWDSRRGCVDILVRVAAAWAVVIALLAAVGVATGTIGLVASDLLAAWAVAVPALVALVHIAGGAAVRGLRALGVAARTAVVVGAGPTGRAFAQRVLDTPAAGIKLVGFFDDREPSGGTCGLPMLGLLAGLPDYVRAHGIEHIYIALPVGGDGRLSRLTERLLDTTASVSFLPQVLSAGAPSLHLEEVAGVPLFTSCDSPFSDWGRRLLKRTSDIVVAGLGLAVAAPIMAMVAVAVKVSSSGPILFRQRRHGLDGREIVIYKFRTMTVMEDGTDVAQAQEHDPRVTRLGSFLRRRSLDELPQLFNVLQGRMSIIGPRPHALVHNDHYRKLIAGYARRHKVKPGLSGWAQVHGCRGETRTVDDMRTRIEHDLFYLRNWSLWLDLRIAMKTVRVLFRDPKAY
jgi:putative colanic acid biosynthesis UDP-glucose lipid carrier transferase